MTSPSATPLLDQVREPADLRRLPREALAQVADELRRETIDAGSPAATSAPGWAWSS